MTQIKVLDYLIIFSLSLSNKVMKTLLEFFRFLEILSVYDYYVCFESCGLQITL